MLNGLQRLFCKNISTLKIIFSDTINLDTLRTVKSCAINEMKGKYMSKSKTQKFPLCEMDFSNYFVKYLCFEYIFSYTICLDTLRTVKVVQLTK